MTDTVDAVESFPDLLFLGIGCIHSTSGLFSNNERFTS